MSEHIEDILIKIKKQQPMILNMGNYFARDFIANGLRSMGAMPIMSNAEQEIDELFHFAQCVVINIGKLDDPFIRQCEAVCHAANEANKPIIFAPVGAGTMRYRNEIALRFLNNYRIAVVHGYEKEIAGLLNGPTDPAAAQPIHANQALDNAKTISEKFNVTVVTTSTQNLVVDGKTQKHFDCDSEYLLKLAGANGLLSSIIGVFHSVVEDRLQAALAAVHYYGLCVNSSAIKSDGPGSFKVKLIDALYRNSSESI